MVSSKTSRDITGTAAQAEKFGPALSQILKIDGDQEVIIGQAWLAGPNQLVTCGHVIEPHLKAPGSLLVKFPCSGNRYPIKSIKLHPSFVRQPDQLVKFDLAVISVSLAGAEASARPLPFSFEGELQNNQSLYTVRYPAHLGQLTASPQPLTQQGLFLGHLRKHDSFHLLHDLALSSGDSGSAIFAGGSVAAIHCGDTASLPGLNLPTTSIRLAIWIDALKELGLTPTAAPSSRGSWRLFLLPLICFFMALLVTVALVCLSRLPSLQQRWAVHQPPILPVSVNFNQPLNGYKYGDPAQITVIPRSNAYLYLFDISQDKKVYVLFPPYGSSAYVNAGEARTIDRFGSQIIRASRQKDKLLLVALISDFKLVAGNDWSKSLPADNPLMINGDELTERIQDLKKADPDKIMNLEMDAPTAQ